MSRDFSWLKEASSRKLQGGSFMSATVCKIKNSQNFFCLSLATSPLAAYY